MMEKKTIGEINGGFSIMFRIALATYPVALAIMVAFSTWVVTQIHELDNWRSSTAANRFTSQDWMAARREIDTTHYSLDSRVQRVEQAYSEIVKDTQKAALNAEKNHVILLELQQDMNKRP